MLTREQIAAAVTPGILRDALDPDKAGAEVPGRLAQIIANAVLEGGTEDRVLLLLVGEKLYELAGIKPVDNPFTERVREWRAGGGNRQQTLQFTPPPNEYSAAKLDLL